MTEAQNREKLLEARRVLEAEFDKIPSVLAKAFADVVVITGRVMADLLADVRAHKCHRDDLHKANNRYLERARTAERERDAWRTRWEKATGQTQEQYPIHADRVVEEYAEEYDFRGDGGGYTPTAGERAMLIDFGHGLIAEIEGRAHAAEGKGKVDG